MSGGRRELEGHAAVRAWLSSGPRRPRPELLHTLKEDRKSAVYRLYGVGRVESLIAKRTRCKKGRLERFVYEEVLPLLPLTSLRYYGSMDDPERDEAWLFIEDAGELRPAAGDLEHRELAVRWLTLLHTSGCREAWRTQLPDRGPEHYLGRLRSGKKKLGDLLENASTDPGSRAILTRLATTLDAVESHWEELVGSCNRLPQAIVHGDFSRKNLRVGGGRAEPRLLVLDWETAGIGAPAGDFTAWISDPNLYLSFVRGVWPHLTLEDIRRQRVAGSIFRLVTCIDWDTHSLRCSWRKEHLWNLKIHESRLARRLSQRGG